MYVILTIIVCLMVDGNYVLKYAIQRYLHLMFLPIHNIISPALFIIYILYNNNIFYTS